MCTLVSLRFCTYLLLCIKVMEAESQPWFVGIVPCNKPSAMTHMLCTFPRGNICGATVSQYINFDGMHVEGCLWAAKGRDFIYPSTRHDLQLLRCGVLSQLLVRGWWLQASEKH